MAATLGFDGLHERLVSLREDSGMTLRDLRDQTGMSVGALHGYERGVVPNAVAIEHLAACYGVNAHWITTGEGRKTLRKKTRAG